VTLRFLTALTPSQTAAFNDAAAKWSTVRTGDLTDIPASIGAGQCGANSTAINETIDDVLIFVTVAPIDGPSNVLGFAGPCFLRSAGNLTVIGMMVFDVADVATMEANGTFTAVVLHEMAHVFGLGSLWSVFGLLQNPSPNGGPPLDTFFNGPNGIAGFNAIGGTTYTGGQKVPVENTGGEGTVNSHWRKSVLQNELMTGSIAAGPAPLSQLTARSLQDLGYTVNAGAADAFFVTLTLRAPGAVELITLGDDVYRGPLYTIDALGRTTRIR
jgi:hypothetical protein